ncbi:E3 ubiquitin-protein ligase TRIM39-like isoform X2 [Neoarius graeffei]|uniref:E3 ubiquitin-protein ligase TRIM39-like isoform X2 n=1 Tax=Neoarius graeffei TaxID=443677 RepID=UPI00298C7FE8|nr:E3 ubiquitin-protein ligase TRIM39-like isoform X2 [Neoarius graeffei]
MVSNKRPFSDEDFTCPVCCDVFKEPVLLSCGHSACDRCVHRYWDIKGCRECPLCRKRSATNPTVNLALKNLCQTFLELRGDPETLCDLHGEKLKLFCVNDGQVACLVCRNSSKHLQHRFIPVDEAASEQKKQAEYIRNQIKEEFKKLRQFLQKENRAMITQLKKEEQQKTKSLESKLKQINQEITSLSDTIKDIRKEFEIKDIKFLKVRLSSFLPVSHPSIHPSIHPSGHSSIYPLGHSSIHQAIHPSGHTSIRPFIHPSGHPSIHLSGHPSIRPFVCPSGHQSIHPSIRPSIHQAIHPSIHPNVFCIPVFLYFLHCIFGHNLFINSKYFLFFVGVFCFSFLQNFEKTLAKAKYKDSDPSVASGEVIDVAMYVGNLQFRLWNKMQSIIKYTPVVLDPNTAHSQLVLSSDLTSMRDIDDDHEDKADMPRPPVLDTPEQFRSLCVLGSEGFSSGLHCWDIKVGNNTFWMLGVTTETVPRKEPNVYPKGTCGIGYDGENLCVRSPLGVYTPLPLAAKPKVVRIRLDMDFGEVWFLDPASNTVLHMFSHHFTEKVFPIFHSMCSRSPLKIMPLQHSVVLGTIL